MADYTQEINEARREVEDTGELCRYLKFDKSLSDTPWEDVRSARPTQTYDVYITFITAGEQSLYRSGTTVGKGGYTGIMAEHGFEVSLRDRVMRGTEALSIKNVVVTKVNEQPILYQLALAR